MSSPNCFQFKSDALASGRCYMGLATGLACLILTFLVIGCTGESNVDRLPPAPQRSSRVVAVSYALQYLTQRIVGDEIQVDFPASEVDDPQSWKPTVPDIAALQRADLIVVNGSGAPFAQWLVQVTLPANRICESCEDIPLSKLIAVPDHQIVHSHGPEGEHSHAYMVPYTWLDPELAAIQARTIGAKLDKVYPELKPSIADNLAQLLTDLASLADAVDTDPDETVVITANPQMKYLTRAAGLNDVHLLMFEPANLTQEEIVADLERLRKQHSSVAAVLINDPALSTTLSAYCKDNELQLIQIDLLGATPKSGDFISVLQNNYLKLAPLRD